MVFGKRCQRDIMGSAGSTRSLANNSRPSQRGQSRRVSKPSTMSLPLQLDDVSSDHTQSDARNAKPMSKVIRGTRPASRQSSCQPDGKAADKEAAKPPTSRSSSQNETTQTTSTSISDADTMLRTRRQKRHTGESQGAIDAKTKVYQKQILELESANLALEDQIHLLEENVEYLQSDIQCSTQAHDYEEALKIKDKFIQKLGKETREIREEVTKLKIKYKRKIRSMNCQLTEARQTNCIKILELKTALEQLREENEQLSDELYQLKQSQPSNCDCHLKTSNSRLDKRRTGVIVELSAKVSEQNSQIIALENSLTEKDRIIHELRERSSSANSAKDLTRPGSERRKGATIIGGSIQRISQSEPAIGELTRTQSTECRGNSDSRCVNAAKDRLPIGEEDVPEIKEPQTTKTRQKKSPDDHKGNDRNRTVVTLSEDSHHAGRKMAARIGALHHARKREVIDENISSKPLHSSRTTKRSRGLADSKRVTSDVLHKDTQLESSLSDDNSWDNFSLTEWRSEHFAGDASICDSDENKDDDGVKDFDGNNNGGQMNHLTTRLPHHSTGIIRNVKANSKCHENIGKIYKGISSNDSNHPVVKVVNARKQRHDTVLEDAEELIRSLADKRQTISTFTAATAY